MQEIEKSGIPEFKTFVVGIERDDDAVKTGLTRPERQGLVEGTVNKIKTSKRRMYGRASFTLLCQNMLHQGDHHDLEAEARNFSTASPKSA